MRKNFKDEDLQSVLSSKRLDSNRSIKLACNEVGKITGANIDSNIEARDNELLTSPLTGTKISKRNKVEGRIDQKLEVQGSVFSGRDETQVLKQEK